MDLRTEIKKKGIKSIEVEYILKISHTSYFNKLNGKTRWTSNERKLLQKILGVSSEEIKKMIPDVRIITKTVYPKQIALEAEFSRLKIDPIVYAEKELHITPLEMARKMQGSYAFTKEQKEKIRQSLGCTQAQIDEWIPVTATEESAEA